MLTMTVLLAGIDVRIGSRCCAVDAQRKYRLAQTAAEMRAESDPPSTNGQPRVMGLPVGAEDPAAV